MAAYGFVASVLPVWLLLEPRDYLSTYLKLGTIAALVVGTSSGRKAFMSAESDDPRAARRQGATFSLRERARRARSSRSGRAGRSNGSQR